VSWNPKKEEKLRVYYNEYLGGGARCVSYRELQNCLRCMGYDLADWEAQNLFTSIDSFRNGCIPYDAFQNQVRYLVTTKQKIKPVDKKVVVKPNGRKKIVLNYGGFKVVKVTDAHGHLITKKFC